MNTTSLVQLTGLEALQKIVAQELKLGYDVSYLDISPPLALNGTKTRVAISVNKYKSPVDYWAFENSVSFVYDRLSFNDLFGTEPVVIKSHFPVFSSTIVKLLGEALGIKFESIDIVSTQYDRPGVYTLQAGIGSYRWIGTFDVRLTT